MYSASLLSNRRDLTLCNTAGCNNLDRCATAAGYTSLTCNNANFASALALPAAAADIKCHGQASATVGNRFCAAFTTFCGPENYFPCPANVTGVYRVHTDIKSLAETLRGMLQRIFITMTVEPTLYSVAEAENKFYSYNLTTGFFSAGHPTRRLVSDVSFCNTDGCNAPAADSCALAGAPAVAAVRFGGLDSTKFDTDATSGKKTLKATAVVVLQNSIQTAVQANACATCTVKVTSVVEDATGNVLFQAPSSSRRLQTSGGVTVNFATSGGTAAQLAAVTTASTSAAFTAAVTSTVASNPGYSGVTASAVPVAAADTALPLLGLLGLLGLLAVLPLAYWFCCRAKAPAPLKAASRPSVPV